MLLVACSVISACSSMQRIGSLTTLPLPDTAAVGCCWQVLQQLEINSESEEHNLQAALALTQTAQKPHLTLILLDALGRRMVSVRDNNDPNQQMRIDQQQAAGVAKKLPGRFLLAAVYLAYWPDDSWQKVLTDTDWALDKTPTGRTLYYHQQAVVSVDSRQPLFGPDSGHSVILRHHLKTLGVTINTRQRHDF
jgi:hypothetical protein